MLANIFLTSALVVTLFVLGVSSFDHYFKLQDVKKLQETHETITEIKKILATQYNKNPEDITRDEIIAILPKGKNWEKLFFVNNNNIIDEDGNFEISQDDKLQLLALKSKLKNFSDLSTSLVDEEKNIVKFIVSSEEKNRLNTINVIKKDVQLLKEIIYINIDNITTQAAFETIIYNNTSINTNEIDMLKNALKKDLKKSQNSMDLIIYKKIKAYL